MKATSIDHICLAVKNLEQAKKITETCGVLTEILDGTYENE